MPIEMAQAQLPGCGVGLRSCHYSYILENLPKVGWFEVLADNYFNPDSIPVSQLLSVCEHYPVTMHSVGLSIGSTDPLNKEYLANLKMLAELIQPKLISDHLCWVSVDGNCLHELLPLPYTKDVADHVAARVRQTQDYLGRRIALENASSYLNWQQSTMTEWDFLAEVAEKADCYILLDVNNIYVSAHNHGFSATEYLAGIPAKRVAQFHLAGYKKQPKYLLDSHSEPVHPPVWQLYRQALDVFGVRPTLIEWDDDIPEFPVLHEQALMAEAIMHETTT